MATDKKDTGFIDKRTGKWIRGFEGVHRQRNRRGFQWRKARLTVPKSRGNFPDLREKLQRIAREPGPHKKESDTRHHIEVTRRYGAGEDNGKEE